MKIEELKVEELIYMHTIIHQRPLKKTIISFPSKLVQPLLKCTSRMISLRLIASKTIWWHIHQKSATMPHHKSSTKVKLLTMKSLSSRRFQILKTSHRWCNRQTVILNSSKYKTSCLNHRQATADANTWTKYLAFQIMVPIYNISQVMQSATQNPDNRTSKAYTLKQRSLNRAYW